MVPQILISFLVSLNMKSEAAKRHLVHHVKSTNGRRKWKHYDGVSASTTAVKWRRREERDERGWREVGLSGLFGLFGFSRWSGLSG